MAGRSAEREFRPYDPSPSRNGYREAGEPADGRPVIVRGPFWDSESERLQYEFVVHENPRRPGEGVVNYIVRIAELKAKHPLPAALKDMPRLPYRDDEEAFKAGL